ncbi:MAG: PhoH family protein [Candidatus Nanopelagicales bacterium]|jgi:phosphate starvation-inducible PhoH-like protein
MSTPSEATITVPASQPMVALLGPGDELLRVVEAQFPEADIHVRGNEIRIAGSAEDVGLVEVLVAEMLAVLRTGQGLTSESVERSVTLLRSGTRPAEVLSTNILSSRGRTIRAKSLNQKRYVEAIDSHTVTFGIGPAGTGKTYLAVAKAVQALQAKKVTRIILTRPAVEAGEKLGFLPGTLSEKIDPYLRPLYDALHDMVDPDTIPRLITGGTIEIAPLAYMRGRTLNDAFIILDEAQNTTAEQMKMFLTRLGFGSTMVVTGDVTQVDLPAATASGLTVVQGILEGLDDVSFCRLTSADVVRHRLVGRIVEAYGRYDAEIAAVKAEIAAIKTAPPHRGPRRA